MKALIAFLLWCLLLAVSWPLALLAIAVNAVFGLLRAVLTLPARLLGGGR
jgi:hypothetical protein